MNGFTIREATRADTRHIAALWHEMMECHREVDPRFAFGVDAQRDLDRHIAATIHSRHAFIFVAEAEGRVVGYILGELHNRRPIYPAGIYGFISDVSVTAEWRRRGVARRLVERAKAWFGHHRVTVIELFAAERNPSSLAFWRTMGWAEFLRLMRYDTDEPTSGANPTPPEQ